MIENRWVYRVKRNLSREIDRLKSRVIAKGYHKEEHVDFFKTLG